MLPGEPTADLEPYQKQQVIEGGALQKAGNQIIRDMGEKYEAEFWPKVVLLKAIRGGQHRRPPILQSASRAHQKH